MTVCSVRPVTPFSPAIRLDELVNGDLVPRAFVDVLQQYAADSYAAHHPLLDVLAAAEFRAPRTTLRRFFREYYAYSWRFTRFLGAVMAALERPDHRAALVPNSAEEAGQLDEHHRHELRAAGMNPDDVAAPHPELFRRFLVAIRLPPGEIAAHQPHVATLAWIQAFEALCRGAEASAVGALGLATEGIVRGMYGKLLAGIRLTFPELGARERAFFELHAMVDDDHAQTLRTIASELAVSPAQRRGLVVGVLGALATRASFYDQMHDYLVATDEPEDREEHAS